jgi:hypothetical protein
MTTAQIKKAEKIASESMRYARKAIQKTGELEAYLSFIEYKAGKTKAYPSVRAIIRAAKRA